MTYVTKNINVNQVGPLWDLCNLGLCEDTRQILSWVIHQFGRIQKVWVVTFNMLDLWPSACSLLAWQKNLRFLLSLPNKLFAFPPFGRQMEAWVLSFLLFVSSCFFFLFIFQIPLLLVAWMSLAWIYSTTAFQLSLVWGLQNCIFIISEATTEEILVRNTFKIAYNILIYQVKKNLPMQWDKH